MLCSFVDSEPDWERYLPLVLYAANLTSICASPFQLMYEKKHLIKSLMLDCYLNLSHIKLEGNYYNGLKIFYQIEGNVCICVGLNQTG